MGYVSLSEDNFEKFNEFYRAIDISLESVYSNNKSENEQISGEVQDNKTAADLSSAKQELSNSLRRVNELQKSNDLRALEVANLQTGIAQLKVEKTGFILKLNEKENLLVKLRREIKCILENNEHQRRVIENRNEEILQNSINNQRQEKADFALEFRREIGKISAIVNRQNFYKDQNNINQLKLIVKNLLGL